MRHGEEREARLVIMWLLEGSRGGRMRAKILLLLKEKPMNPNQLAKAIGANYRTITHHLKVLEEHGLVRRLRGKSYGAPYVLTEFAERAWGYIRESARRVLGDEP